MERVIIAKAVTTLEELLGALNNAYWEAINIHQKDTLFDVITSLHEELNELAKLSVEDHDMAYEPITLTFRSCCRKLKYLASKIDEWFPRTSTAEQLEHTVTEAAALISNQCLR
ncbi:hypothetical protein [Teredinibacter sp. KSP-S5-2]|uniref:hypothetical protein n=1 Tax=Teredinibacter sp. KSP-S5-2 TaxID=3034506 RepID=UPI0029351B84|nr:hypothetical protein [Teredinibacter sp. KSP-S5-2]WNO11393.1 hypothetical protein P5V12_09440 [Teredinibacter sp. KSP-S5-2]